VELKKIATTKLFIALLAMSIATVAAAGYIIWTRQTEITIIEPLTVTETGTYPCPVELEVIPGASCPFQLTVTNDGSLDYTAVFAYSVTADHGVKYTITPASGTEQTVPAGDSVTFDVTVEIAYLLISSLFLLVKVKMYREALPFNPFVFFL